MKITIQQKELRSCLQAVSKSITKRRGTLPRSRAVHISRRDGGKLKIAAADGPTSMITVWPEAKVHGDGEMLIPYSLLSRIVLTFSGELTLASKGPLSQELSITEADTDEEYAMGSRLGLHGEDPQHFPTPPRFASNLVAVFTAPDLRDIMRYVGFAAAQDQGRPVLTGLLFKFNDDKVEVVAADGFRLARLKLTLPPTPRPWHEPNEDGDKSLSIIIPAAPLMRSLQALPRGNQRVRLTISDDRSCVRFAFGDTTVDIATISGNEYPKYQELFPATFGAKIALDGKRFRQLAQQAIVVAEDSSQIVRLKAGTGAMSVTAHVESASDYKGQMPAELTVSDKTIETRVALNVKYLNDFLALNGRPGQGGQVIFDMSGPSNPTMLSFSDWESYQYLLMPMFVSWESV